MPKEVDTFGPRTSRQLAWEKAMSFKDVLVALTTYPEPTPESAVDDAVDLAAALGAKISAIACEVKVNVPGSVLGDYLLDIPAMVATEVKKRVRQMHSNFWRPSKMRPRKEASSRSEYRSTA
jgi:hypothetical protein